MKTELKIGRRRGREQRAFSLLEVMIAIGIFFMAAFAILGLVSSSLEYARRLQRPMVEAGAVAGELSLTNKLVEGVNRVISATFSARNIKATNGRMPFRRCNRTSSSRWISLCKARMPKNRSSQK